jgi:hypothetical protein
MVGAVEIEIESLHYKSRKRNDVAPPPLFSWSLLEPRGEAAFPGCVVRFLIKERGLSCFYDWIATCVNPVLQLIAVLIDEFCPRTLSMSRAANTSHPSLNAFLRRLKSRFREISLKFLSVEIHLKRNH